MEKAIEDAPSDNKPFWQCQECGYIDRNKPMPKDRSDFYIKLSKTLMSPLCPKCKSVGFMP